MTFRPATPEDHALLAELNHQLIRDEGHWNKMSIRELEQRMEYWLTSDYAALLFEDKGEVVAYALYYEEPAKIYLRHLFVARHRRRQGVGREVFQMLRAKIWPRDKRLTVDVLAHNTIAIAFWRSVGFQEYCLTMEILPETPS